MVAQCHMRWPVSVTANIMCSDMTDYQPVKQMSDCHININMSGQLMSFECRANV